MIANNNNQTKSNSSVDSVDMLSISRNIDEFKSLDNDRKGYLDENQAKSYFESQCSSQKSFDTVMNAAFDQNSQLGLEKFLIITHLLRLNNNNDSAFNTNNDEATIMTRFSNLLRHCEESLKQVEKERKNSSTLLSASKVKLSAAMEQLESCWKDLLHHDAGVTSDNHHDADIHNQQQLQCTDNEEYTKQPEDNNFSPSSYQNTDLSGTPEEVMPGSFDFDKIKENKSENQGLTSANNAASMTGVPPVAPPRKPAMLSIDSQGRIVTSTKNTDSELKPHYENEPNLSNSLSFSSQTPQYKEPAKERSMSSDNVISGQTFDESRPTFSQRTSTMNTLESVRTDLSAVSIGDIKRELEISRGEDDMEKPSSSIAKDVVVPIAPTTVIPNRAVEDPIIESNEDSTTFASSVSQHPMVRSELFSNPSFYSCNSYRSADDNNINDTVSAQIDNGTSQQPIDRDQQQFGIPSASETITSVVEKEAPQITVPVTKSPILSDAQFTNLTGIGKPELSDNLQSSSEIKENDHDAFVNKESDKNSNPTAESIHLNGNNLSDPSRQMASTQSDENHISVLPLLAVPAVSGVPLNKNISNHDLPSDNVSDYSDIASGAISPPPSRSDVKQSMANTSPLGPMQDSNEKNSNIESSTVKEPLYQPADAAVPGVNEITDSLDRKLDLIIEDDPEIINENLQPNDIGPQQNDLLSTHGSPMANNKRHSVISTESRFIELEDDHISPMMKNARSIDRNSNDLHHGEAPQVPSHSAVDLPPSPSSMSSEPHNKTANRLSMYTDQTAAKAIQDTFDLLATPSGNNKDKRVLNVRKGFEGFCGLGIDCVHNDANQV